MQHFVHTIVYKNGHKTIIKILGDSATVQNFHRAPLASKKMSPEEAEGIIDQLLSSRKGYITSYQVRAA